MFDLELLKMSAVTNNITEVTKSPKTMPATPNINIKPINMSLYNFFIILTNISN